MKPSRRISVLVGVLASLFSTVLAFPVSAHSHAYVAGSVVILAVGEIGTDGPGGSNGGVAALDTFFSPVAFTYCQDSLGPAACVPGIADQLIPACGVLDLNAGNWDQTLEVYVFLDGGVRGGDAEVCEVPFSTPTVGIVSHTWGQARAWSSPV